MPLPTDRVALAAPESAPELLRDELEAVEEVLHRYASSEVEVLEAAARHILSAGGKRIRPQLLILAALSVNGAVERAIPLAAATELIHTATLVHDDVVDESDSRRGRSTVQLFFGNSASVLMGDYLVVRAFSIVAEYGDPRLWRALAETIARMCEGEVLQICTKRDLDVSLEVYETVIECKTAILMATCGRFGAYLGTSDPEITEALAEFGYNVGMAFQIADDILDFVGEERTLGKPVGNDLREGKVTLPVIYALQRAAPEARAELAAFYERPAPLASLDVERACAVIRGAGGFARAREHALEYQERAQAALLRVPASAAREALQRLAESVVDREA
jgi:octaprenyl-diphosphate synthase